MKTVDKYKKQIRKMFFLSVDNDIDKWTKSGNYFYSELINNDFKFKIDTDLGYSKLTIDYLIKKETLISKYLIFIIIPIDFKLLINHSY